MATRILILFATFLSGHTPAIAQSDPLAPGLDGLNEHLSRPDGNLAGEIGALLSVDFHRLAARTFKKYYTEVRDSHKDNDALYEEERAQLVALFRQKINADLEAYLRDKSVRQLRLARYEFDKDQGKAFFEAETPQGRIPLQGHLIEREGRWKMADLELEGQLLSDKYRERYKDIIKNKYSLSVLAARMGQRDYIALEDFSTGAEGRLPELWFWRKKDKKKPKLYAIQTKNCKPVLAAQDTGSSVVLLKRAHWNPRQYPIMTWCWRADALPSGGDERHGKTNDSAAGIYVVFSKNWLRVPRQIKYVWSSTVPMGTVGRRNGIIRPWFFVVESGEQNLGKWTFEQVDLFKDHQRVFDGKPKKRTLGLGILTDANATNSHARAYYSDLRVWTREAQEKGLVQDYCACLEERRAPAP